jgi:hypothetical protein
MQVDAYHYLQNTEFYDAAMAFFRPDAYPAWTWFLRPIVLGNPTDHHGAWGRFLVIMNNMPVWGLTLPSIVFLAVRARRERRPLAALPALLFGLSYLQVAAVDRPMFLYSALVLLPFAFLAAAHLVVFLLDALRFSDRTFRLVSAFVVAWGLYLVPLVLNRAVPAGLYAPFFALLGPPR